MNHTTPEIIHIIGQLTRGGAEKQLAYLARSLKRRGWRQSVVSLSHGGYWKEFLIENDIPVYEIAPHPLKPYRLWQLSGIVRRIHPAIIMSWSLHAMIYAHCLIFRDGPRRICAVRGDLRINSNSAEPSRLLDLGRYSLQSADHVVSNSAWGVAVLQKAGLRLKNWSVISNITEAPGRANVLSQPAVVQIISIGTLKYLKGYDVLLRALHILSHSQRCDFVLRIAGDGPERSALIKMISDLGLSGFVQLLGQRDDVQDLLASAHIAVHPSRSEGLSNTILEAMAEGLPVVAAATGGTPEIISHDVNGLLVPPDDPDALAAAIKRLLSDGPLRFRIGTAALSWVRRTCHEEAVTDRYEALFKEVNGSKHR